MWKNFWSGLTRRSAAELALLAGLVLALAAAGEQARFCEVCRRVRGDTLRLHVVANSNSEADQTLKLRVRDAVLAEAEGLVAGQTDRESAEKAVEENLRAIASAARRVVEESDTGQRVAVRLVEMEFPTTHYEGFTLPAGQYRAVRVELGEAQGHNWFCVLYPGICLSAASADYPEEAENEAVTGSLEVRFAALEWWEKRFGGS